MTSAEVVINCPENVGAKIDGSEIAICRFPLNHGLPKLVLSTWRMDQPRTGTDGYVVNNHGDRLFSSPKDRVVGPLPNGLSMAWK